MISFYKTFTELYPALVSKLSFTLKMVNLFTDNYLHIYLKPLKTQLVQLLFSYTYQIDTLCFVLTNAPNVGERFTKTRAQLHTSVKNFGEK